jgi:hypothetical protein
VHLLFCKEEAKNSVGDLCELVLPSGNTKFEKRSDQNPEIRSIAPTRMPNIDEDAESMARRI